MTKALIKEQERTKTTDILSMAGYKAGVVQAVRDFHNGRAGRGQAHQDRQRRGHGQGVTTSRRREGLSYQGMGAGGRQGWYPHTYRHVSTVWARAYPPDGRGVGESI